MANHVVRLTAPVLLGALVLLFPAGGLRALGLGEARIDSWLGQPLDVAIRLLEMESAAVESISVGPASLKDFERLGLPSQSLALGLEVSVDRRSDPPMVRVRSQRPVNDPIVQILIDARWSNGRVLREYTLFLDPPVIDSAAPVRAISQPEAAPARAAAPADAERQRGGAAPAPPAATATSSPSATTATPAPPAARPEAFPPGAAVVTVESGNTLWSIAHAWRPSTSLSMDQVMLAIFNRNRDAFLEHNINNLRSDARLEMPDIDDVQAVDRAAARRQVHEHMQAWRSAAADEVPVISDAAMPEAVAESPGQPSAAVAEPAAQTPVDASDEETAGRGEDYRLNVVPPEEGEHAGGAAAAEGEIERIDDQLAGLEEEIMAEGLASETFDRHAAEIRNALAQRDLAGLAVAEESLAEFEDHLRRAREARAAQDGREQMAGADAPGGADDAPVDPVAEYMRELQETLGGAADEPLPGQVDADAVDGGTGAGAAPADEAALTEAQDDAAGGSQEAPPGATDPAQSEHSAPPMTVTRTAPGTASRWLWPIVGLLVLVLAAGAWLWSRRRRQAADPGAPALAGSAAVEAARAVVARRPSDLDAHLALLRLLADEGREEAFTDAFDQMYQAVDDESTAQWQAALSLAGAHVPDHPLLTPPEVSPDEGDEDFQRRADELFGMLGADDDGDDAPAPDAAGQPAAPGGDGHRSPPAEADAGLTDDMDLALLSERLDEPAGEPDDDFLLPGDADFDEFSEIDEFGEVDEPETEAQPERMPDEPGSAPDLDLGAAREQEADEIFGQADVDDFGELDSDFGFEAGDAAPVGTGPSVDFEPDAAGDEPEPSAAPAPADADRPAAAGTLSDDDADVKLDLARAYISVDLSESARPVLEEVISEGSPEKRAEAQQLLDEMD